MLRRVTFKRGVFGLLTSAALLGFAASGRAAIIDITGSPTSGDPNLTAWFRADAGITLNGGTVARWDDMSDGAGGNALLDVMHGTAANQPTFVASQPFLNNMPALRFDGTGDFLRRTVDGTAAGAINGAVLPVTGNSDRTIFAVVSNTQKRASSNGVEHILHMGNASNDGAYGILVENAASSHVPTFSNHYWGGFDPGVVASGASPRQVTFLYDNDFFAGAGRAGADRMWVDGMPAGTIDLQATNTVPTAVAGPAHTLKTGTINANRQFAIGSRIPGTTTTNGGFVEGYFGDIAEVIIYNQALSTSERQSVESYLANKYGLNNPPGNLALPFSLNAGNFTTSAAQLTYNGGSAAPMTTTVNGITDVPIVRLNKAATNETGTVFTNRPVTLADDFSFNTHFTYKMSDGGGSVPCCGDNLGADGLSFIIHADSRKDMAIGITGGSNGTTGLLPQGNGVTQDISIKPALIVELDTWNGGAFDTPANTTAATQNGNHVAINTSTARYSLAQSAAGAIPQHASIDALNQTRNVWVDYDGKTKEMAVYIDVGNAKPAVPTITKKMNLNQLFNTHDLYVGFAGATGGAFETHDIVEWNFDSQSSSSARPALGYTNFDFPDFTGLDFLFTFNGGSTPPSIQGDRLRLTENVASQGTSAILSDPAVLPRNFSFRTAFSFEASLPGGSGDADGLGADGFTFVLTTGPRGPAVVGGAGGGLGIAGASANYVAVEFDTWVTGSFDPAAGNPPTHIGVDSSNTVVAGEIPVGAVVAVPRFNDGGERWAWIEYDGITKQMLVYLSSTPERPLTPQLTTTIDVAAALGYANEEVYMGFTAGTGGAINRHEINSWSFVPEPSTYVLASFGFVGLFGLRRRMAKNA